MAATAVGSVGDGPRLHQRGHALEEALGRGEQGRDLVVVVVPRVHRVQRHRPVEHGRPRGDGVRNDAAHERITGEVLVRAHDARGHDTVGGVELGRPRVLRAQAVGGADRHDRGAGDRDRAAQQHVAVRVHRDDVAGGDEEIDVGHGMIQSVGTDGQWQRGDVGA